MSNIASIRCSVAAGPPGQSRSKPARRSAWISDFARRASPRRPCRSTQRLFRNRCGARRGWRAVFEGLTNRVSSARPTSRLGARRAAVRINPVGRDRVAGPLGRLSPTLTPSRRCPIRKALLISRRPRRRPRALPLQGLPRPPVTDPEDDEARCHGIHPALSPARAATRISPHSLVRPLGPSSPPRAPRPAAARTS